MEDVVRLGEYCVKNHITLEDLQLFSNELKQYKIVHLDARNKHYQHFANDEGHILVSGDLVIDRKKMTLKKGNLMMRIHDHEFLLVCLFVSNPHEVITDQEIIDFLSNFGNRIEHPSMVVYMSRVSKIIGDTPINTKYIQRKRNKGYYWNYMTYRK